MSDKCAACNVGKYRSRNGHVAYYHSLVGHTSNYGTNEFAARNAETYQNEHYQMAYVHAFLGPNRNIDVTIIKLKLYDSVVYMKEMREFTY